MSQGKNEWHNRKSFFSCLVGWVSPFSLLVNLINVDAAAKTYEKRKKWDEIRKIPFLKKKNTKLPVVNALCWFLLIFSMNTGETREKLEFRNFCGY